MLVRFNPGAPWPLVLAAVRDEFADRPWDPPATHWAGPMRHLVGGLDRLSGGTWLAVDPAAPAVAAVLNGERLPLPPAGVRPTRGSLPLAVLAGRPLPADVDRYNGFHLLLATTDRLEMWSWDGRQVRHQPLSPGNHVIVNGGADVPDDPLVPHFGPLLAALPDPDPRPNRAGAAAGPATDAANRATDAADPATDAADPATDAADPATAAAWPGWVQLLAGDGLDPADPRALIVRLQAHGHTYASTSATLVALAPSAVRYDFTANPGPAATWAPVPLPGPDSSR